MADQGQAATGGAFDPQGGMVYDSSVAYSAGTKNTWQAQKVDPAGAAVANGEGRIPCYSAATVAYAVPSPQGDFSALFGSPTKTVRLKRVAVSGRAASAGQLDVSLIKRTSAFSSSTSAVLAAVPHDVIVNATAPTATLLTYSSSGSTAGFGGVNVRAQQANVSAAGSGGAAVPVEWHFGDVNDQALVLRSTSEAFALNAGSTAPATTVLNIFWEWSEE